MDINSEYTKRQEFKDILMTLAEDQEICSPGRRKINIYKRLEQLYWADSEADMFRHYYSDIFEVLSALQNDEKYSTEALTQNLEIIMRDYKAKNQSNTGSTIDISKNLKKLYDHVNLEVARLSHSDAMYRRNNGDEDQFEMNTLKTQIDELKNELSMANERIRNQQKEYITILGIFASVILAFVGSFTFSASVLGSMSNVQVYRHIITVSLVGIVFFNMIYILLDFIRRINTRSTLNTREIGLVYIVFNFTMIIIIVGTIAVCYHYGVAIE